MNDLVFEKSSPLNTMLLLAFPEFDGANSSVFHGYKWKDLRWPPRRAAASLKGLQNYIKPTGALLV